MKKRVVVNSAAQRAVRLKVIKIVGSVIFVMPLAVSALDFSEAEKLIKPYDAATRSYLYERMMVEANDSSEAKHACEALSGGGVTQVLRINQDGAVDLVVSNVQTPQAECFEKFYLGRAFKAPPSAPVYIKHKVGYAK